MLSGRGCCEKSNSGSGALTYEPNGPRVGGPHLIPPLVEWLTIPSVCGNFQSFRLVFRGRAQGRDVECSSTACSAEVRYAHLPFTASRPHFIFLIRPSNEATCGGVFPPWLYGTQRMGPKGSLAFHPYCTMAVAQWRRRGGAVSAAGLDVEGPGDAGPPRPLSSIAGYRGLRLTEVNLSGHPADRALAPWGPFCCSLQSTPGRKWEGSHGKTTPNPDRRKGSRPNRR